MNDFTLTKVGSSSFVLVDNVVAPGTGHIDVASGIFRMESATKLNGSATNTLTVRSGAELELYQLSNIMGWSLFFEDSAIIFDDPDHSREEQRFLLLGASDARRILVVAHCYREEEELVRIISAREATRREREAFLAVRKKP